MTPGGLGNLGEPGSPGEPESPGEPGALGVSEVEGIEDERVAALRACPGSVVEALGEASRGCSGSLDCGHADEPAARAIGSRC